MLRILLTLQPETYKDILLITKKKSKIYLISCWSILIIFIITSNYKDYIVKYIVFLILSYLNYLWLVLHLFVRHVFKFALSIVILKYLDILNSEKKCELIFLIPPKYIYIYIYLFIGGIKKN